MKVKYKRKNLPVLSGSIAGWRINNDRVERGAVYAPYVPLFTTPLLTSKLSFKAKLRKLFTGK